MAKLVKVTTTKHADGAITYTSDQESWTDWRLAGKITLVAYESISDITKPYCIGIVKDEDLAEFIQEPNIKEITQVDAETLGALWRPQEKIATDPDKLMDILDKVHNSLELTQSEKDAINPDNIEPGINNGPTFAEILTTDNMYGNY
jgi:hypothetical protein